MLKEIHPVLPCQTVASAIDFYIEKLGFQLKSQDAVDPTYAVVRRDGVEFHLQWHDATEWARVERPSLRFLVSDVETLHAEFRDKDVFHSNTALRETHWGTREFAIFDLNQNGLTFYQDL